MKSRAASLAASAFFLIAPGAVAGLIPWWITGWRAGPPLFALEALSSAGWLLVALGVLALLDSFWRFAWFGMGTPSPLVPTHTLVVSGLYRYVRNPMYLAVVTIIIGQALVLGSAALLAYAALVGVIFHLFVISHEEPSLRYRFGHEYALYYRNVRRWRPRLKGWHQSPLD